MRAFLSVNLDGTLKKEFSLIQEDLKKEITGVRWVKPELLHVTLKFLGEIDEEVISTLEAPLNELAKNHTPFSVTFSGLGVFPTFSRPRVIWIGMDKGSEEFARLVQNLEAAMASQPFSFPETKNGGKDFVPHLTLGRAKKNRRPLIPGNVLSRQWKCDIPLTVDRYYLMRSELQPSGPVYTPLKEFLLK